MTRWQRVRVTELGGEVEYLGGGGAVTRWQRVRVTELGGEVEYLQWWCSGCDRLHAVPVTGPRAWQLTMSASPTLYPSVRVLAWTATEPGYRSQPLCHGWMHGGRYQFLEDSTHALAGQTVDLPEIPEDAT